MIEWIISNKKWLLPTGIIILIGIPIVVYLLSVISLFPVGGNNDWAGFWGGYLGSILGGLITLFALDKTIQDNKNNLEKTFEHDAVKESREKRQKFCDEVCRMAFELCLDIVEDIGKRFQENPSNIDTQKKIEISSNMLQAKIKSKLNDDEYRNCNMLLEAVQDLWKSYLPFLTYDLFAENNDEERKLK